MPEKHVKYLEQKGWDAAYFKRQAEAIGPNTLWIVSTMLESKLFIEQTYNACLGVLGLGRKYGHERLEKSAARARQTRRASYQVLSNILKNNMDKREDDHQAKIFRIQDHVNIRGAQEYT